MTTETAKFKLCQNAADRFVVEKGAAIRPVPVQHGSQVAEQERIEASEEHGHGCPCNDDPPASLPLPQVADEHGSPGANDDGRNGGGCQEGCCGPDRQYRQLTSGRQATGRLAAPEDEARQEEVGAVLLGVGRVLGSDG